MPCRETGEGAGEAAGMWPMGRIVGKQSCGFME